MCGIVLCIHPENAIPDLVTGLKKLEYRGYDSSGIARFCDRKIHVTRSVGKLSSLEALIQTEQISARIAMGHTRWATHGKPTLENCHPHVFEGVAVSHNGIIENYNDIKNELVQAGHGFSSQTDTEVIAHLIRREMNQDPDNPEVAIHRALSRCRGSWALVIFIESHPETVWCCRKGSPLFLGQRNEGMMAASDIPALLPFTQKILPLQDQEIIRIQNNSIHCFHEGIPVRTRSFQLVATNPLMAEKEGYKHFMLKEIFEQPRAVYNTLHACLDKTSGMIRLPEIDAMPLPSRITICACGTSYYAGMVARGYFEQFAKIFTEVEISSEFRYRDPLFEKDQLVICISQSGETADTLAAVQLARDNHATTLGITNTEFSQITQLCDFTLKTHAGPEIGVASTKAFTTQLMALLMLSCYFKQRKTGEKVPEELLESMISCPSQMHHVLSQAPQIQVMARRYAHANNFMYIGRGYMHPIALEGALKLKEISYIHAEGTAGGEMKHGPIALLDENLPVVVLAPQNRNYEKIMSNVEEVLSRNAQLIAVGSATDLQIGQMVHDMLVIPAQVHELVEPILAILPLQLLAYCIADFKGTDVDQPRNLAKSVTVE